MVNHHHQIKAHHFGRILSWEPKGTPPMPRLPPGNKALLRDY